MSSYTLLSSVHASDIKILQAAWDRWGQDMQVDICIEEMSELTKALLKKRRGRCGHPPFYPQDALVSNAVCEEFGDLLVCLQQFEIQMRSVSLGHGATLWDRVCASRDYKVNRLRWRLTDIQEGEKRVEAAQEAERIAAEDREVA